MIWICPRGHGTVDKSPLPMGGWGYYHPLCGDCGEDAVDLDELIKIATEVGRLDEAQWTKANSA